MSGFVMLGLVWVYEKLMNAFLSFFILGRHFCEVCAEVYGFGPAFGRAELPCRRNS